MVGVVALATVLAANAGSVNWTAFGICSTSGAAEVDGYSVYFLMDTPGTLAAGEGNAYTGATYGRNLAVSAIEAGDLSFLSNALYGDNEGVALTEYGEAVDNNVGDGLFNNGTGLKAYAVILDADDPDNATKAFVTTLEGGAFDVSMEKGNIDFSAYVSATSDPKAWMTVGNAPEPTSGLLLLLGVAGLALRRRRA